MPPIQQQQTSRGGLITALVITIVLLVGCLVWGVMTNADLTRAQNDLKKQAADYKLVIPPGSVSDIDNLKVGFSGEADKLRAGTLIEAANEQRGILTKMITGKSGTEKEAAAMLAKGDLKFRLKGKRLNGDFALIHMKGRRPGSKGTEWLLIKKKDESVVPGFDIDKYDTSVLTGRTMSQIAGDKGSAKWTSSRPASGGKLKAAWLADAVARADKKRKALTTENTGATQKSKKKSLAEKEVTASSAAKSLSTKSGWKKSTKKSSVPPVSSVVRFGLASSSSVRNTLGETRPERKRQG